MFPSCIEQDLGVLARVPLASRFLSGKYKLGTAFTDPHDVRSRRSQEQTEERPALVQEIQRTEVPEGVAMACCLRHPAVTCVIPGCKTVGQVVSNAGAAKFVSDDHPQCVSG